jgi:hypothetical protein
MTVLLELLWTVGAVSWLALLGIVVCRLLSKRKAPCKRGP